MTSLSVEDTIDALPHIRAYLSSPAAVSRPGTYPHPPSYLVLTPFPTSSLYVRVFFSPMALWELGLPQ